MKKKSKVPLTLLTLAPVLSSKLDMQKKEKKQNSLSKMSIIQSKEVTLPTRQGRSVWSAGRVIRAVSASSRRPVI